MVNETSIVISEFSKRKLASIIIKHKHNFKTKYSQQLEKCEEQLIHLASVIIVVTFKICLEQMNEIGIIDLCVILMSVDRTQF